MFIKLSSSFICNFSIFLATPSTEGKIEVFLKPLSGFPFSLGKSSAGLPGGSRGKETPVVQETQETWVQSRGWEDPLEEGMATHSSVLAWGVPRTEEPGGLQSRGRRAGPRGSRTHCYKSQTVVVDGRALGPCPAHLSCLQPWFPLFSPLPPELAWQNRGHLWASLAPPGLKVPLVPTRGLAPRQVL